MQIHVQEKVNLIWINGEGEGNSDVFKCNLLFAFSVAGEVEREGFV